MTNKWFGKKPHAIRAELLELYSGIILWTMTDDTLWSIPHRTNGKAVENIGKGYYRFYGLIGLVA